jgi:hypothetical protein
MKILCYWLLGYRYKLSIPCAKKVVVLKSFVIELLWYMWHLRIVLTRFKMHAVAEVDRMQKERPAMVQYLGMLV